MPIVSPNYLRSSDKNFRESSVYGFKNPVRIPLAPGQVVVAAHAVAVDEPLVEQICSFRALFLSTASHFFLFGRFFKTDFSRIFFCPTY